MEKVGVTPVSIPGGELYRAHHAILQALTIRGRSLDNSLRAIRWPTSAAELTRADFEYLLPDELIAQHPPVERGASRLLHVEPGAALRLTDLDFGDLDSLFFLGTLRSCTAAPLFS